MGMVSANAVRWTILLFLGIYLFVYPFGIVLMALDQVPDWGTWFGGGLLILQGATLGVWLVLNNRWRGVLAVVAILVLSWLVEHVGVTTGFPFGGYHYTDTLNLKIIGVVPLAVPFAWLLVVPAALGMAEYLLNHSRNNAPSGLTRRWQLAGASGGSLVERCRRFFTLVARDEPLSPVREGLATEPAPKAPTAARRLLDGLVLALGAASFALLLDLMIEPLAVHINGYWVWNNSGTGYYGVPGSNFVAWWVTSFVLALILLVCRGNRNSAHGAAPVYEWLPRLFYLLNLTMFVLIYVGHGKVLALSIGMLLLLYLVLARVELHVVRWVMDGRLTPAPVSVRAQPGEAE